MKKNDEATKKRVCLGLLTHPPLFRLYNGKPDGLIPLLRFRNALHQAMQPDAGIHNHTLHLVLTHQNTPLRIGGIIPHMNPDALETGHTLHIG